MALLLRHVVLCAFTLLIGILLFQNDWFPILLALYFVILSPTDRITDGVAPLISLFIYSLFASIFIQCAICYMMIYWFTIVALTIVLPRYSLKDFQQPSTDIIQQTKREKAGLDYYLEHESPSDELLQKLSQTGDDIVDELMPQLLKLIKEKREKSPSNTEIDAVEILLENVDTNPKFQAFIEQVSTVPDWCDFNQLNIAQKLHQRLSVPFAYVLGICTLVGGFGCPEINRVLLSSRYWSSNNTQRSLRNTLNRLRETATWLYSVMRSNEALKPLGAAWKSILRVRLLHSKVRHQLKQSKKSTDDFVAINQLHLTATLLGFQYNPLVVLRVVLGVPITRYEVESYTALWRYIGYVMGCVECVQKEKEQEPCVPLQSFAISRAWMVKIWDHLIYPDVDKELESTTLMLSKHVLNSIGMAFEDKKLGQIFHLNKQTIEAFFRALLTEEYADMIQLAAIHWAYELQMRVILALMRIVPIVLYQLHLNWIAVFGFRYLWHQLVRYQTFEVMQKKDKYSCRFAKYCGFAT